MSLCIKTIKLYNSYECPVLGLGTWRAYGNEIVVAVKQAILNGYRHIDTATLYDNEVEIGQAIDEVTKNSNISRKDLFITTKLPGSCNRPNLVVPSLKQSLKKLSLNYVDLFLIHTPISRVPLSDDTVSAEGKTDHDGNSILEDIEPAETWKEMESCVKLGLAKSIGVSNFNSVQLQSILDSCSIKPAINQVESHPFLPQTKLQSFCEKNDIAMMVFRPLGGQEKKVNDPSLLDNETVQAIAFSYNKLPSQILLRWHVQQNRILLAKSVQLPHLLSNADIFNFSLTKEDMNKLSELENGHRYCPFNESKASKHYPFHIDF